MYGSSSWNRLRAREDCVPRNFGVDATIPTVASRTRALGAGLLVHPANPSFALVLLRYHRRDHGRCGHPHSRAAVSGSPTTVPSFERMAVVPAMPPLPLKPPSAPIDPSNLLAF